MITTTIEWTGDPGDGLAHQQPVPPYMVEFGRGKSDTLLCMREFAPVVIVDGSRRCVRPSGGATSVRSWPRMP